MKKWIAILLAAVLLLSVLPMMAMADGGTKVYLKPSDDWKSADARFAIYYFGNGDGWASMTASSTEGVYEATVPAGYNKVIFCRMNPGSADNNWSNKWNQTGDLDVPTDNINCYTITSGWDNPTASWGVLGGTAPTPVIPTYLVAGVSALCGDNWSDSSAANALTEVGDGTYQKVYTNVAVGTDYAFKVVDRSSGSAQWYGDPENNAENVKFNVTAACDVTITYDPATHNITVAGSGVQMNAGLVVNSVTAAGNGASGNPWLNGFAWNPAEASNHLSVANNIYSITYELVPAGNYDVKLCANDGWGAAWGTGAAYTSGQWEDVACGSNQGNISFSVEKLSIVKLELDLSAFNGKTLQGAKFRITVTPAVYTITFDAGEGTVTPATATTVNRKLAELPTPERTGYTFLGWFTAAEDGDQISETTVFTQDATIYAHWVRTEHEITLDANGGTVSGNVSKVSTANGKLTAMPADPVREGYKFLGWYTSADAKVDTATEFSGNATITAKWEKLPVVTFDAGEGKVTPATAVVGADGKLTELPTPVRNGYRFEGWYNGQTKVEAATVYTADTTLTAKWAKSDVITVYAKVPENWDGPGIWAWNDKQENAFDAWPGLAMTEGEDGWWYAQVPSWVENIIINAHDGQWQTADLDLAELEKDVWLTVTVGEDGIATTQIEYANPKTGDGNMMFAVAAALLLAGAALVTTVSAKKKFF